MPMTFGMMGASSGGPPILLAVAEFERNTEPVVTFDVPSLSLNNVLVVITSTAGTVSTYGVPAGTTEITSNIPSRVRAFYYVSTGSFSASTMNISFATSTLDDKSVSLAMVFGNVDTSVVPVIAGVSQPSDSTPTPPSVTAVGWAAANNLAVAMTLGTGTVNVNDYPSNCPLYRQAFNAGALGFGTGVACAETTALTFAPTSFTLSSAQSSNAVSLILKGFS